jgi:hypothetical protein
LLAGNIKATSQNAEAGWLDVNGYVSAMPSAFWQVSKDTNFWQHQNVWHSRMNFYGYHGSAFSTSVQIRTQLIEGDYIEQGPYKNGFRTEGYWLPLSYFYKAGDNFLIYSMIDRAWVQYTHNNLDVKVGRQRINWGQTLVWNPNDMFNSYNFFDFDYEEKPGSDGIRLQYYTGMMESFEMAFKTDSADNISAAMMYKFNTWEYDIQLFYKRLLSLQMTWGGGEEWLEQLATLVIDRDAPPITAEL